jgi:hypothetical protein
MLRILPPAEAGVYHLAAAYGGNQKAKLQCLYAAIMRIECAPV